MIRKTLFLCLLPVSVFAGDITVEHPMVPLAPPGAKVHAAYMTITNGSDAPAQLIGIDAEGYAMAHLHRTVIENDVASMSAVELLEIAPGQSITLEHGSFHIMMMQPDAALAEGGTVPITLKFADGAVLPVTARVMKPHHNGQGSHGDHDHGS